MHTIHTKKQFVALVLITLTSSIAAVGCSSLASVPRPVTRYTVNYAVSKNIYQKKLPVVIKLEPFGAAPEYATNRMIYSDAQFQRNAYVYHQWISPPAEMVVYALAKDLKASRAFSAVVFPGERLGATHVLSGSITDFYEKNSPDARLAVLGISVLMISQSNTDLAKMILLEKQYTTEVTCQEKNAAAFAAAMNTAVKALSGQILRDIHRALADQPG